MPRRNPPTVAPSRPAYGGPQVMGPGQGMLPLGPRDDVIGPFGTGQRGQGPALPPDVGPFEQTGTDIMNLFNTGTTAPHWSDRQMSQMYGLPLYQLLGKTRRGQAGTAIGSAELDRMYRNVSGGLGYYGGQLLPNMFGGNAGGPQFSMPPGGNADPPPPPLPRDLKFWENPSYWEGPHPGGPGMGPWPPPYDPNPPHVPWYPSPWGDWNAQPGKPWPNYVPQPTRGRFGPAGFPPPVPPPPPLPRDIDPHGPGGVPGFAQGGDFITDGPQMIMVGDNPGGVERVQIDPMTAFTGPVPPPGPGGYVPGPGHPLYPRNFDAFKNPPQGIDPGAHGQFQMGNPFDELDELPQPVNPGGPAPVNVQRQLQIRRNANRIMNFIRGRNKPNAPVGPIQPLF